MNWTPSIAQAEQKWQRDGVGTDEVIQLIHKKNKKIMSSPPQAEATGRRDGGAGTACTEVGTQLRRQIREIFFVRKAEAEPVGERTGTSSAAQIAGILCS